MYGYRKVRCAIWRGGTSKGVMLRKEDLPPEGPARDQALLTILGSPDVRQINGIGGATPTTSKVAILSRSERADADVDYTFAQVAIDKAEVDYGPNCGNVSAAVGPYAVDTGLVPVAANGRATVRIFNTNTGRFIHSEFAVKDGAFVPDGDTVIPGVPGTGSEVVLNFLRPDGGATGQLFPTGNLVDEVRLADGRVFRVSVVDAGNLSVLVDGRDLENAWDSPWFDDGASFSLGNVLEEIRQAIGRQLNLYQPSETVTAATHALPKITVLNAPHPYQTRTGQPVDPQQVTIVARAVTMGKPHPAYPITGGTALAAAVRIPGTVGYALANPNHRHHAAVIIGHPGGMSPVEVAVSNPNGVWQVDAVKSIRTARALIEGMVFLPE
ncbi:PrpF domain-containing protein [Sulfobacillus harzensis]|uniref:3-methylitaconate isomerase n=1 Tax=Sulfobacillus harzensis TaxID=2729629 RepID=A0A7Y0L5B0_9FIRM|nr:PrpF domain-containing protein [Sulfobacillus harzensis]NMP23323.1 3-methylitaconate isomerase [Sulfobacillus harzensis]